MVVVIAATVDIRNAIGFSSFCVLFYYAVANASALTLRRQMLIPAAGVVGCLVLAFTLPLTSVAFGAATIAAAAFVYPLSQRRLRPDR